MSIANLYDIFTLENTRIFTNPKAISPRIHYAGILVFLNINLDVVFDQNSPKKSF